MTRIRIACLVGPTACGKTATSVEVARRLSAEIVSADSVQVYRALNIGSAKPTREEMRGVPHHLIDCLDVDTPAFSVSAYLRLASEAIEAIHARGHVPLIVGGSGLYVNALTYPLSFAIPADPAVRAELERVYDESPETLYKRLQSVDPASAGRIHLHDKKRVVRSLEVHAVGGRPLSEYGSDFQNAAGAEPPFDAVLAGIRMDRERLYARINARVDGMLQSGLIEEARAVFACGYSDKLPAMQSIGYRQLFGFFRGEYDGAEAVERIKRESRRYAKRQMTWFSRDPRIRWFDAPGDGEEERLISALTEYFQTELQQE